MEIRLLLVDDEDLTREGLLHYIDWSSLGITRIKAASNGQQALTIIEDFKPDILLTDIRMPHISGIELARKVKELFPESHVLLISGYAEKEYLRSAINLKVDAYIDKPAIPDNVSLAVLNSVKAIHREREKSHRDMLITQNLGRTEDIVRDRIGLMLIQKEINWKEFHEAFAPSYFTWEPNRSCSAVCLRIDSPGFLSYPYSSECFSIREFWDKSDIFSSTEYFSGMIEHSCIFFLVTTDSADRLKKAVEKLQQWILTEYKKETIAVIGPYVSSYRELSHSCHSAVQELICAHFYENIPGLICMHTDFVAKPASPSLFFEKPLSPERYITLLDIIAQERFTNINYISQKLYELYLFIIQHNFKTATYSLEDFLGLSLSRLRHDMEKQISKHLFPTNQGDYESKIRQAIQYIFQHYDDESLSIKIIADYVELSQNYFCTLFKKNCGMTVNNFIINVRIDRAKYLLKNTNLKLYEISQQIGIPDANYLNILFKKICHTTPSQYRREAQGENND